VSTPTSHNQGLNPRSFAKPITKERKERGSAKGKYERREDFLLAILYILLKNQGDFIACGFD